MNDWMRSVADIPPGDDEDDDLAGISPELVLVDPDLARLVRERGPQPAAWEAETARRGLRLVPVRRVEDGAAPIVPRPVPTSSTGESPSPEGPGAPPASSDAPHASAPQPFETPRIPGTSAALTTPVEVVAAVEAPAVSPPPMRAVEAPAGAVVDYAPPASEREAREPDVEAPPASEPVAPEPRVVDAELARALAPEPPRGEIPPPLADPVRAAAVAERHAPPPLAQAVMPHPVARPAGTRPRTARGTGRSRRRWPAFLAVAVASAAVFGAYQVFGGSQDPAGKPRGTAAVGVPPHANATSGSKSTPKPKQATTSRPKPTPKKVAATTATPKPAGTPKKTTSKQRSRRRSRQGRRRRRRRSRRSRRRSRQGRRRRRRRSRRSRREAGDEAEDECEAEAEGEPEARRPGDSAYCDPPVRMGSGGRRDGLPRRAVQGRRPSPRAGYEGAGARARIDLALPGSRDAPDAGDVSLVRMADHAGRPGLAGDRPGEASGVVARSRDSLACRSCR